MGATAMLRVDGTITLAHSAGKQQAEATFKKTFGFHSLGVWVDNTDELAALMPRPGGAGRIQHRQRPHRRAARRDRADPRRPARRSADHQ